MESCPDYLTIQAVVDGEEKNQALIRHLQGCPACSKQYQQMKNLVSLAEGLKSEVKAPADFYRALENRLKPAYFPAGLVAAVIFSLTLLSLLLLGPSYFQWWLSVGITRQVGLIIDTLLDLLALGRLIGPVWIAAGLAALVAMELFILKMLNNVEGWQNA